MTVALYPGTFDPIHYGHIDIAQRAAALFDKLIIAVYDSPPKRLFFSTPERVHLVREALRDLPNLWVTSYQGLTVEFARKQGADVIVRGLRAISDFEFEFQMALMNQKLAPEIEFCAFMTSLKYTFLSASILKEVALLGGDISDLAPPVVQAALQARVATMGSQAHDQMLMIGDHD